MQYTIALLELKEKHQSLCLWEAHISVYEANMKIINML